MKLFLRLVAAGGSFVLLCSASGCNSPGPAGGSPAASGPKASTAIPLKVALLTSGDVNDQGWNQLGYESLQRLKADGDAVTNQVCRTQAEHQPAMRDLASNGYNLELLHGFEYGNDALALASSYPQTDFVVVAGSVKQAPNVATLVPKLEDATFLLGIIAGGMTRTGKIGLLGGADAPEIRSPFEALREGALLSNPKAQVLEPKFVGWDDQNAGKAASQALLAEGADILFQNADQAGKGMFAAAKEAKAAGKRIYVFGSNANQNGMAPDVTLASAVIDLPGAFEDIARRVQKRTFNPGFIELNLKNKRIALAWNPALKAQVPAALVKRVDQAAADIVAGKISIKRRV